MYEIISPLGCQIGLASISGEFVICFVFPVESSRMWISMFPSVSDIAKATDPPSGLQAGVTIWTSPSFEVTCLISPPLMSILYNCDVEFSGAINSIDLPSGENLG